MTDRPQADDPDEADPSDETSLFSERIDQVDDDGEFNDGLGFDDTGEFDSVDSVDDETDPFDEIDVDVDAVDPDALWDELAGAETDSALFDEPASADSVAGADATTQPEALSTPSGFQDLDPAEDEAIIDKRSYCQQCPHFSSPPAVQCDREETTIVEVLADGRFRLHNCPVVTDDGPDRSYFVERDN